MDPLTLILTALASGAAASVTNTTDMAVKDAYSGLKSLILHRFAQNTKLRDTLIEYEDDPETYEKPLKKVLTEERLDHEQDIILASQKLMKLTNPQQAAMGKFNIQVVGGTIQGLNQGDNNTITQYFGDVSKDR